MSELLRLAKLCEKATGADRELDGLIYRAVNNVPDWKRGPTALGHVEGPNGEAIVPHSYTASIDAAMTLVPPNRSVIQYWIVGKKPSVSIQGIDETERDTHTNANTKELALCAAALRSRHSLVTGVV